MLRAVGVSLCTAGPPCTYAAPMRVPLREMLTFGVQGRMEPTAPCRQRRMEPTALCRCDAMEPTIPHQPTYGTAKTRAAHAT